MRGPTPIVGPLKIPTQSDLAVIGRRRINNLPGNIVLHQLNVKPTWRSTAHDLGILSDNAKHLRILAIAKTLDMTWSDDDSEFAIRLAAKWGGNCVILPSERSENEASFLERRSHAQKYSSKFYEMHAAVGLDIATKSFPRLWRYLIDANDPLAPIRLTGYAAGRDHLNRIANTVSSPAIAKPPFVVGYDAARWMDGDPNRGASPLWLRRVGFQATALRVYRSWADEQEEDALAHETKVVLRLDAASGGYRQRFGDLPSAMPAYLEKPRDLSGLLEQRKFEENLLYASELGPLEDHVRRGDFPAYRRIRPAVDGALGRLGINES